MEVDLPKLPKGERRAETFLKTKADLNSKLVLATDMSLNKSRIHLKTMRSQYRFML